MDDFKLGKPALVCRWRLANGRLPLESRHLKALAARRIGDARVEPALVGWVKQRIEWGLDAATRELRDGVLMLVVDEGGSSALSLGPYRPLENASANELLQRALGARGEGEATGVAPEELWVVEGNHLVWATSPDFVASGASTLIFDLARTMGMPVRRSWDLLREVGQVGFAGREVFLVSDEHGVVPASDHGGQRADKFAQSYERLLSRTSR